MHFLSTVFLLQIALLGNNLGLAAPNGLYARNDIVYPACGSGEQIPMGMKEDSAATVVQQEGGSSTDPVWFYNLGKPKIQYVIHGPTTNSFIIHLTTQMGTLQVTKFIIRPNDKCSVLDVTPGGYTPMKALLSHKLVRAGRSTRI